MTSQPCHSPVLRLDLKASFEDSTCQILTTGRRFTVRNRTRKRAPFSVTIVEVNNEKIGVSFDMKDSAAGSTYTYNFLHQSLSFLP